MNDENGKKIEKGYRFRSPAPETLKRLEKVNDKFNDVENSLSLLSTNFLLMKQNLENIGNNMKQNVVDIGEQLKQNAEEHKAILAKIDALQKFMYMVMGALIVLQLVLKFISK